MSATEVARLFHARREGKKWRAKCPVHRSNGLTLAIYADTDSVGVYCFAGCSKGDILASVGLTWRDTLYNNEWLSDEAYKELQRNKKAEELRSHNIRLGEWIIRFAHQGYTRKNREEDITAICECAWVLSHKTIPHWESILRVHLERIEAADHCRRRGMLPNV